jgi:hypothetical protein
MRLLPASCMVVVAAAFRLVLLSFAPTAKATAAPNPPPEGLTVLPEPPNGFIGLAGRFLREEVTFASIRSCCIFKFPEEEPPAAKLFCCRLIMES